MAPKLNLALIKSILAIAIVLAVAGVALLFGLWPWGLG